VYKCTLCEHGLYYSLMLSISKLTYFNNCTV